ncbi:unnamed protein product [Protopolystoma xenopodis]|uniref:FH2 domain-containing protein n=1 Tax=Protopolystoma xenopodis TaxID=117903 RepID=A0A448WBA1_9PLAT|nr:unnamed protein product [Protopolystoma xenopodis]
MQPKSYDSSILSFISSTSFLIVPLEALTSDVAALSAGLHLADSEQLRFGPEATPSRLTKFLAEQSQRVANTVEQSDRSRVAFARTLEWFGEAQAKPSPEQFFGIILRFVDQFKVICL